MAWNGRIPSAASLARLSVYTRTGGSYRKGPLGVAKGKELRRMLEAAAAQGKKAKGLLEVTDKAIDGNGVEDLYPDFGYFYYVNMGDTYDTTLCYNARTGTLFVGAWGDFVEKNS